MADWNTNEEKDCQGRACDQQKVNENQAEYTAEEVQNAAVNEMDDDCTSKEVENAAKNTADSAENDEAAEENAESSAEADDEAAAADASAENPEEGTGSSDKSGKPKKERKMNWANKAKEAKAAKEAETKAEAEAKLAEANDKYLRLFAEFDNFRTRSEKEKAAQFEMGAKSVIEKMLPIVDNFERGLAAIPEEEKGTAFADGMDKIYKQLLKSLEDMGVKPIEAVGAEFNPEFHNAVMHVDDDTVGENIVVEEFQKGYTYKDHLVRPSMVKVAN